MLIDRVLIVIGFLAIFSAVQVNATTCEECREIEKTKTETQHDITEKEKDLASASEKKEFKRVLEIRANLTNLRKKVLDLKNKDEECKQACRPDVVKTAECSRIRDEILKLEDESKPEDEPQEKSVDQIAKIDGLYRDLQRCNKDLTELKKTGK